MASIKNTTANKNTTATANKKEEKKMAKTVKTTKATESKKAEPVKVTTKEKFAATLASARTLGEKYGFSAKELDAVKNVIKFYNADGKCVLYVRACRAGYHFQMKEANVPSGIKYHLVKWQLPAVVEVATEDQAKVIFAAAKENKFAAEKAAEKAAKEAEKAAKKAEKTAEKKVKKEEPVADAK